MACRGLGLRYQEPSWLAEGPARLTLGTTEELGGSVLQCPPSSMAHKNVLKWGHKVAYDLLLATSKNGEVGLLELLGSFHLSFGPFGP